MPRYLSLLLILLAAPAAPPDDDPLLVLLAQDDEPQRRDAIQEVLRSGDLDGCARLSAYARARDARARENAVRAMGRTGCAQVGDYRPYFSDGSAWVADALLDALSLNRVAEGVPYALARLGDRRRLVSDEGSWTVSQSAQRTLRTLTGQPIRSLGAQGEASPDATESAWRAWYAEHGEAPPSAWIESGLAIMREAIAGSAAAPRLDVLETAALIGDPGRALLAEALRREPSDLEVSVSCAPEEPPRVLDVVPCVLWVRNATSHRVAFAPGEVGVELTLRESAEASRLGSRRASESRDVARRKRNENPGDPTSKTNRPARDARALPGRLVDLAPGESLRRQVRVGPVGTAGRYEVKVRLADLWEGVAPPESAPPPIESALILRFEQ